MKKHSNWQVAAALSALLVLAPACGREDPGEADEMQALLDQEPTTPLADDQGTAADDGYGNVEAEPVDVSGMEPKRPEPAPRPSPRPAPRPAPEPEPEVEEPEGPIVRAGTRIALSSDMELSTEDVIPGDPIIATVSDDVIAPDGQVLIPRGSKLLGRVVQAQESTGPNVDPVLEVAFETLSTVDYERPIHASVVEVEMESSRKDSDKRTAAKIGGAAAAGAILGKVLGKDTEGAVKGGVAGAVAGTVIAMETRSGHAKIKTGALIVVELTRELLVR
jgi:hypothetical protein